MTANSQTSPAGGARRWVKLLGAGLAALLLLGLAAYFVLTSAWFIKSVVLPRAGAALNATVTADDASLKPFSSLTLSGLKVHTAGDAPLISVRHLAIRYPSLTALANGRILVDDITVDGLTVNIVQNADGSSNLDALTNRPAPPAPAAPAGPPPTVAIKKITVSDASLQWTQRGAQETRSAALSGFNLTLANLGNSQTATLQAQAALRWQQADAATNHTLSATLQAQASLPLDAALQPSSATGAVELAITTATGLLADTRALAARLQGGWTPTELRALSLSFTRSNQPMATVSVNGPYDAAKGEARLQFQITGISGAVLNLAGAPAGLDFNQTTLTAAGLLEMAGHAQTLRTTGAVQAARFSLTRAGQTTPPLDLDLRYAVQVSQSNQTALVSSLVLTALQTNRTVLEARLAEPMRLAWGATNEAVDESVLRLAVHDLDLAQWRAFAPEFSPAGRLNLQMGLLSQRAGQHLAVSFQGRLTNFSATVDTNIFRADDLQLEAQTVTLDFTRTDITRFHLRCVPAPGTQLDLSAAGTLDTARQQFQLWLMDLRYAGGPEATASLTGTGVVDLARQDVRLHTRVEASLPQITALAGLTNAQFSQGRLQFDGLLLQHNFAPVPTNAQQFSRSLAGSLLLTNLTGRYEDYVLDRFSAAGECDLTLSNDLAVIRRLHARFTQSGQAAGTAQITGQHHLTQTNGQWSLQLAGLNEHLFRSAAARLGSNRLDRAVLSASLQTTYGPDQFAAQGNVQLADLQVTDPAGLWPKTPFSATAALDVQSRGPLMELRNLQARFQQGSQPAGALDLAARFDRARTNAQFQARIQDLNQHALRPLLSPWMDGLTLEKGSVNLTATGQYDPAAASSLTGAVQIVDLVFHDPKGEFPRDPLSLSASVDAASTRPGLLHLRSAAVQLTPTARATNLVRLAGQLDLASLSAITGQLAVTSTALDFTPYYRMFSASSTTPPTPAPAPPPAAPPSEPEPMTLPLTNFTLTANVERLYLEELACSNLTARLDLSGPRLHLTNFSATVNGAPARGHLAADLGVPGYQYDAGLNIQRLPLAPLAASFMTQSPDPWRGDLSLALAVQGVGSTGPNLRRHLGGHLHLDVTNAALQIKQLLTPGRGAELSAPQQVLRILVGILDPLLNSVGTAVGIPNLVAQPFDTSRLHMQFGQGNIYLRDFTLANSSIIIGSRGTIPIADQLPDSPLDLPVEISLARQLAQRFQIASAPTNATHVKLPDFVLVRGTLAQSQTRINTKALAGTALQQIGKQVGGDTGSLLQGVGSLFGGGTKPVTNAPPAPPPAPPATHAPSTNAPGTNAPINNLLNDLFRPKPRQ